MKNLLAVLVVLALAVPATAASPAGAEAAIQKAWQQFSDAWGRGDAHARAALWAEDGSLINPFGVEAHGRAAIEKLFEQEDAGFAKGTTNTFSNFSYRFLTPTIAEVDATGTIEGIRGADGAPMPALKVHIFAIMAKTGYTWQMKDARPYMIAPPPGPPPTAMK
jgi:uncharacterized protein (TIGR02246 family)